MEHATESSEAEFAQLLLQALQLHFIQIHPWCFLWPQIGELCLHHAMGHLKAIVEVEGDERGIKAGGLKLERRKHWASITVLLLCLLPGYVQ